MFKQSRPKKLFLLTNLWLLLALVFSLSFAGLFHQAERNKVEAATSSTINFQARLLTNGGALVPDGYYNVQFNLYNVSSGGTSEWTETYYDSNGVTAGNDNRVRVVNGYLSVYLGSQNPFPSTINWDQQQWLTLNIGGTTQTATPTWDGEMSPRLQLSAVPYALTAGSLQATSGANALKLNLASPTANVTYTLQSAAAGSYDVCTTATVCTGYAAASGSGSYIQNGTTPQTADFNITGTGTVGGNFTVTGQQVSIQPASSLTAGQTNISQTLTNASSSGGTVTGYNQTITVSNTGSATTTNGINISLTDNGTGGNSNNGISVTIAGSNSSQGDVGVTANVARGIGLQGISSAGTGSTNGVCNSVSGLGVGVCGGGNSTSNNAAGVYGYTTSRTTSNIYDPQGAGVYGINQGGGTAGSLYGGVKGISTQTANAAYTSVGVYGQARGGTGATVYGGYFTYDSASTATAGAALYASNSGSTAKILQLQDNTTDVFTVADGGAATFQNSSNSTSAFQVQKAGGQSEQLFNVDTSTSPNVVSNPSVETDTSNISAVGGATLTRITSQQWSGNAALQIATTATNPNGATFTASGSSNTWTVSAYVKGASSYGTIILRYNATNCLTGQSVSSSGWTRLSCTTSAGTTLTSVSVLDTTTGHTLYVDGVQAQTGSSATPFQIGQVAINGVVNSPISFTNQSDSTTAFQIQNASGTSLFNVDSLNQRLLAYYTGTDTQASTYIQAAASGKIALVVRGATSQTADLQQWWNGSGGFAAGISNAGDLTTAGDIQIQGGDLTTNQTTFNLLAAATTAINIGPASNTAVSINLAGGSSDTGCTVAGDTGNLTCSGNIVSGSNQAFIQNGNSLGATAVLGTNDSNSLTFETNNATQATIAVGGATTFKNSANSTAAFQIQNAAGTSTLFNVDTTTSNLITNPSFEVDTSGWATSGSGTGLAMSRNTTAANVYHGIGSLQVVTASSAANTGASVTGFTSSITPGTYTLSFEARATVSFSTFNVTITGGGAPTCLTGQTVGTGFQRYSCTFTSSGTNVTAINFITTNSTQRTIYLDAVQLTSGSNSTPYTIGGIQLNGIVNSPSVFQNSSDSTTAFQIQNATGTSNLFVADTTNNRIAIGQTPTGTLTNMAKLEVNGQIRAFSGASSGADGGGSFFASGFSSSSGQAQFVGNWNSSNLWGIGAFSGSSTDSTIRIGNVVGDASAGTAGVWSGTQNINVVIGGSGTGGLSVGTGAAPTATLSVGGNALFHNTSNSTSAFQIQDSGASGSLLFNADTTNNKINIIGDTNIGNRYGNRLFSDDFESGSMNFWDQGGSGISTQTSVVHDGKYAAQANSTSSFAYKSATVANNTTVYARAWVYVASQSTDAGLLNLQDTAGQSFVVSRLNASGNLDFWNGITNTHTNSGTAISTGAWHLIEMRVTTGNPTGVSQVWLDGNSTPVVNLSSQNNGTNSLKTVKIGDSTGGRTFNVYYDDVAADTVTTGTASSLNVDDSFHVGGTSSFGNSVLIQSTSNNTTAFQVQNASGNPVLVADTTNGTIGIGATAATSQKLYIWSGTSQEGIMVDQDVASTSNLLRLQHNATDVFRVGSSGDTLIKDTSTTAFQIQGASTSTSLFNADTSNSKINIVGDVNIGNRYNSRLFSDGFESGGFGLWDSNSGTISVSSTTVHDGKYAAQVNPSSATGYASALFPDNTTAYARAWVYVSSQTSSNADLLTLEYSTNTAATSFTVFRNSGNLWLWNNATGTGTNSGTALSTGAWHLIEMRITTGNPTGVSQVWLDGNSTPVINLSGQNNSTNPLDTIRIGDDSGGRTFTAYIDDVVADTATTGTASSLNVDDSLHVGGTGSFGNDLLVNVTDNDKAQLRLMETNDRGFNLFYNAGPNQFVLQANDGGALNNALTIDRVSSAATFQVASGQDGAHTFQVLDSTGGYIIDTNSGNANVGIATAAATDAKLYALSGAYTVIRAKGTGTNNLLELQNNGSTNNGLVLQVNNAGNVTAGGSATATTKTTEATARTNVTTVTLTSAGFANNDVIRLVRSGTYYYTRIVSGGGTTSLTVSPAVSYDASSTVTKYNVQYLGNDGSTFTGTTRSDNSYFQGYFTGGIVTGTGSTIYSDGNISSSNDIKIQSASGLTLQNTSDSTTAFHVQNTAGTDILNVDTSNKTVTITGSASGSNAQTFNYTGSSQTFTVPAGVTSINVTLYGAGGGQGGQGNTASTGGQTTGTLAVTPGQVVTIYVGGAGGNGTAAGVGGAGGYNGGGAGGNAYSSSYPGGGGGGGGTSIYIGAVLKATAGGGGGGAGFGTGSTASGGNGGGTSGNSGNSSRPGGGGTQSAGGAGYGSGSSGFCGTPATSGSSGQGGAGGIGAGGAVGASGSGGGGGGYYGGGGGDCGTATGNGGGGGGSGYSDALIGASMTTGGGNSGNGQAVITWAVPALVVQDSSSNTFFNVSAGQGTLNGNLDADSYSVNGTPGANLTCAAGTVLQSATIAGGIITGGSCSSSSYARINKTTTTSIGSGVSTSPAFNNEQQDTDNYHTGSNNFFTIPSTGFYNVTAHFSWTGGVSGTVRACLLANSTTYIGCNTNPGTGDTLTVTSSYYFTAGDTIGVDVLNAAGATITLGNTSSFSQQFSIFRVQGGGSGSSLTIGTIDSQAKSADGAVISGTSLYLQTADASSPGLVSTGTQTFAGAKTFSSLITGSAGASVSNGSISLNVNSGTNTTNIGTGSTTGAISIGNTTAGATVTIQGGNTSTAVSIQSAASGTIGIGTANAANTIQIGNTANAVAQTISIGNNNTGSSTNTVTIGSVQGSSGTTIQGGSNNVNVKSGTFSLQDTSGNHYFDFTSNTMTCGLFTTGSTNPCNLQAGGLLTLTGVAGSGGGSGGYLTLDVGTVLAKTNTSNSTKAFQVQNTSGTDIFTVDTTNSKFGTQNQTAASTNSTAVVLQSGNASGATSNSGNVTIDSGTATGTTGSVNLGTANTTAITIGGNTSGTINEKVANASTTAYQLQTAGGTKFLTADTTNTRLYIGNPSADGTGTLLIVDTDNDATILTGSGASAVTNGPAEVDGAIFYSSTSKSFVCGQNGVWMSCMGGLRSANTAVSTAVTSTGDTNFTGGTNNSYSVPANDCQAGRVYTIDSYGTYTNSTTATTGTLKVKFGATTLGTSPAFTLTTSSTHQWAFNGQVTCIDSTHIEAQGRWTWFTATSTPVVSEMLNTATVAQVVGNAQTITLSAAVSQTTGAPSITQRQFVVTGLGP